MKSSKCFDNQSVREGNTNMKVLFVASIVGHIYAFHLPYLEMFKENGYETHIAVNGRRELPFVDMLHDIPFERSPIKISNVSAYKQLKKLIDENEYDVIHCHTPVAAFLTRLAARKARKNGTKVIYTAHGFHFFKGAPLRNWLVFFPVEWISSFFTDLLITINKEDYAFAKKHMHAKRIEYVHGVGMNEKKIAPSAVSREEKRNELKIPENAKVLFSVGELNENKNHEVIIKALAKINNPNIHYIIAGKGNKKDFLQQLSVSLGIHEQVHLLGFRTDINELLGCSDIFCFPSKREGLSVALMEATAAGLPIVCSNIRGNSDLITDGEGGYLCKPTDVDAFAEKISMLTDNEELCEKMSEINKNNIKNFVLGSVSEEMRKIYFQ